LHSRNDKEVAREAVVNYCDWANPPHPCFKGIDVVKSAGPKGKTADKNLKRYEYLVLWRGNKYQPFL
jgi:hypothetical protein